jgi:hypothetical protein
MVRVYLVFKCNYFALEMNLLKAHPKVNSSRHLYIGTKPHPKSSQMAVLAR